MLLMYADESGDPGYKKPGDASPYKLGGGPSPYFVRVGVIVHESKWHDVVAALKKFRLDHKIGMYEEFHASWIARGERPPWDKIHSNDRKALVTDYLKFVGSRTEITLVGVVVDKARVIVGKAPLVPNSGFSAMRVHSPKLRSLELLSERFNHVLKEERKGKGLVILDSVETQDDQLHRDFQEFLYRGSTHIEATRFIESCLAEPSETSEFLQMADMCAYALMGHMCGKANSNFNLIKRRFFHHDRKGHGLKIWPDGCTIALHLVGEPAAPTSAAPVPPRAPPPTSKAG